MNTSTSEAKAQKPKVPVLSHNPTRPARAGQMGEYFFLHIWQKLNRKPTYDFSYDPISFFQSIFGMDATDRDSIVVASFIRWLGTSCGSAYIKELFGKLVVTPAWERSRISAEFWAVENILNDQGIRRVQKVLARDEDYVPSVFSPTGYFFKYVPYSARDLDVIETLHQWFGTEGGLNYLRTCMRVIRRRRRKSSEWHDRNVFR